MSEFLRNAVQVQVDKFAADVRSAGFELCMQHGSLTVIGAGLAVLPPPAGETPGEGEEDDEDEQPKRKRGPGGLLTCEQCGKQCKRLRKSGKCRGCDPAKKA